LSENILNLKFDAMQVKSTESKVFLFDNTNVLESQIC
jgi:hypothetical protein